jgi:hypothetical protein
VRPDEPIAPPGRGECAPAEAHSRLRSVFLQHRLIHVVPPLPGVDRHTAKVVVEQVVDRLLSLPGGLEPLMLLQRDEALLADGAAVAVLAVVLARAAGWPAPSLSELGAAALLADVGVRLAGDDEDPGRAGFLWLLDRGSEDFWLRCALVARHAHAAAGRGGAGAPAVGAAAVVRAARAALAAWRAGADGWQQRLADDVAPELRALVPAVLAGT